MITLRIVEIETISNVLVRIELVLNFNKTYSVLHFLNDSLLEKYQLSANRSTAINFYNELAMNYLTKHRTVVKSEISEI